MEGACSAHRGDKKYIQNFCLGRDHLDGRIILI
jgi:hypothetical protein